MAFTINYLMIAVGTVTILGAHADSLCLKTGTQCSTNCENVILCPSQYANPIKVLTCDADKLCGTDDQGRPSCFATSCEIKVFTCTTSGAVPDPETPSSYYMCPGVGTRGSHTSCDQGKFFNTTTLRCFNDTIPYQPVKCDKSGSMGAIDLIKRFCYICDKLKLPLVYLCDLDNTSFE